MLKLTGFYFGIKAAVKLGGINLASVIQRLKSKIVKDYFCLPFPFYLFCGLQ
jgi:hypothetical protein